MVAPQSQSHRVTASQLWRLGEAALDALEGDVAFMPRHGTATSFLTSGRASQVPG